MKIYAERPTYLIFLASAAIGTPVAATIKDWVWARFSHIAVRAAFLSLPLVGAFVCLYIINICVICVAEPPDLHERMTARWKKFLDAQGGPSPHGKAEDFVDRAAAVLVWCKLKVLRLGETRMCHSHEAARRVQKIEELEGEMVKLKRTDLSSIVTKLQSGWKEKKHLPRLPDAVYLEDPIYGQLQLDGRLFPMFYLPLFQRLNYVRQLSFAYLIFPSASHTRLSHILGVVKNAHVAVRTMFDKGVVYTADGPRPIDVTPEGRDRCCLKTQLCALLHDIGHGPFGHALDKLIPYLEQGQRSDVPDKVYSLKYIREDFAEEIQQIGFGVDEVLSILDKERQTDLSGYDVLVADLIDSALDVDRMDYLVRDAHMTGLGMGYSNVEALIEHMCPFQDDAGSVNLTYQESALPHLENFLYARDIMYINCYEHARKVCAERLLVKLAQYILGQGCNADELMLLTDGQLLATLNWLVPGGAPEWQWLRSLQENCNFYVARDYGLSKWSAADNKTVFNDELKGEVEDWRKLRISAGAQLKHVFVDAPTNWEGRICDEAHLNKEDRWKVVVTVPAYQAKQQSESETRVLVKRGGRYYTKDLFDVSHVMRSVVTDLMPVREVIRVMVSEDLSEQAAEEVALAADNVFKR